MEFNVFKFFTFLKQNHADFRHYSVFPAPFARLNRPVRRLLLIFVQEPIPGRVCPDLAKTHGSKHALTVHRALVRVLLRQLGGLSDCRMRFCFAPDDGQEAVKFWILPEIIDHDDIAIDPAQVDFRPQGEGDLGTRLQRAFSEGFAEGFGKIGAIGCDCIEVSSRWIHAAFVQLNDRHAAVLGATPGGRHHFVGLRTPQPHLLESVPWASTAAYQVSVARAAEQKIPVFELPPLPEIRTSTDYKAALDGPLGPALRKAMEQLGN